MTSPRPLHRACGIKRQDLADDEPVKEHVKRRQVLLDARGRQGAGELLDVGGEHHRLHLVEGESPALVPVGEAPRGGEVRKARVGVSDMGGEELPEAALGEGEGEKSAGAAVRREGRAGRSALPAGMRSGNMGGELWARRNMT